MSQVNTNIKQDSKLQKLEDFMNGVFAQYDTTRVKLSTYVDKLCLDVRKETKNFTELKTLHHKHVCLGCITKTTVFNTMPTPVSVDEFKQWLGTIPAFKAKWNNVGQFIDEVTSYESELKQAKLEQAKQRSKKNSSLASISSPVKYTYRWGIVGANTNAIKQTIHDVDRQFIINRLYLSKKGDYFWKFDDRFVRVPIAEGKRTSIADDQDFWSQWWNQNADAVQHYIDAALNVLMMNYLRIKNTAGDSKIILEADLEDQIRAVCPSCLLKILSFGQQYVIKKSDGGENSEPTPVFIAGLRSNEIAKGNQTSMDRDDITKYLTYSLLTSVNKLSLTTLEQFSNTPEGAITYLGPLPTPMLASTLRKCTEEPTLDSCPTWKKLLNGKFTSPKMGKFRLAYFVLSVLDANNFDRQYLYLVGEGNDGKTTLVNAIASLFGDAAKKGLSVSDFGGFGLQEAVDRRLLVVDDAMKSEMYNFIRSDIVKRFTGAGTGSLQVNIKYKAPVEWEIAGAKMIISTNAQIKMWEEADITRMNPIGIKRSFKYHEIIAEHKLNAALVAEKAEFIQWCVDYVEYFKSMTSISGKPNHLIIGNGIEICTDEQWDDWYNDKELNIFSHELTKAQCREFRREAFEFETTIGNTTFVEITQETGDQIGDNGIDKVAELLLEPSEGAFVSSEDLSSAILYIQANIDSLAQFTDLQKHQIKISGILECKTMKSLIRTSEYVNLLEYLTVRMNAERARKIIDGHKIRGLSNVKLIEIEGFNDDNRHKGNIPECMSFINE